MATENTDDKILSPFYGRKKDIDPRDPEQEITQEQKAQMVEQFKSDNPFLFGWYFEDKGSGVVGGDHCF